MLDRFGQKLKKVREGRKMSQKSLGLFLGLSDKAVSSYESGRTLPTLETLMKISSELNKPMSYFLDDDIITESLVDKINEIELEINHISENLRDIKDLIIENEEKCEFRTPSITPEA